MIRPCNDHDFDEIRNTINDGASAYRGAIPDDCWNEPYMTREELRHELQHGVAFWGVDDGGLLQAVMGIQDVLDVTLIRHAYVRTSKRRRGLGSELLQHLQKTTKKRILIGAWAGAPWAIRFYEKHGFRLVPPEEKVQLLQRYWKIPACQVETSVVLSSVQGPTR
jgi:GNAT superfamily N-acetyltransferase